MEMKALIVAAFVVPADDAEKTDDQKADLQDLVATNLSKHEYPREIHFVNQLPKTASDKIQRFELRDEYAD